MPCTAAQVTSLDASKAAHLLTNEEVTKAAVYHNSTMQPIQHAQNRIGTLHRRSGRRRALEDNEGTGGAQREGGDGRDVG